jgi:hypothetical protein
MLPPEKIVLKEFKISALRVIMTNTVSLKGQNVDPEIRLAKASRY